MVISIKREIRRGKFVIVAREDKKIVATRKWNKKFTVPKAKALFKSNNTFQESISTRTLFSRPDMREFTDVSKSPKKPAVPFRVIASGLLKDGTTLDASSMAKNWGSVTAARQQSDENFFERLAMQFNKQYDADEGMKLANEVRSITHSLVFVK